LLVAKLIRFPSSKRLTQPNTLKKKRKKEEEREEKIEVTGSREICHKRKMKKKKEKEKEYLSTYLPTYLSQS